MKLDFGAVDIGYRVRDNRSFIFEINTAPGLSGDFMDVCNACYTNIEDDVPALSKEELGMFSSDKSRS